MATSGKPRFRLKAGGDYYPLLTGDIQQNNFQHADTFSGTIAYRSGSQSLNWWLSQQPPFAVTIEYGQEAKGGEVPWGQVFSGLIDNVEVDLEQGILTFKGRDKTALFLDHRIAEAYVNKTASEIVADYAAKRGVKADIQSTSTPVGKYYSTDHVKVRHDQFSQSRTEWDEMCQLADEEGFRVWVDSNTDILHFREEDEFDATPYPVSWQEPTVSRNASKGMTSNMIGPRLTHNLAASRDIKVAVRSFHSGKKAGFTKYSGSRNTKAKTSPDVTIYSYSYPNLTEDQAQKKADSLYDDLVRHEMVLEFDTPGDFALTPRRKVSLAGVGEDVDRDFYADEINFSFADGKGFLMSVRSKSIPPQSEAEDGGGFTS